MVPDCFIHSSRYSVLNKTVFTYLFAIFWKSLFCLIIHISCIVHIILCELPQQDQVYMKHFNNSSRPLWSMRVRVCVNSTTCCEEQTSQCWLVWRFQMKEMTACFFEESNRNLSEGDGGWNMPSPSKGSWVGCIRVNHENNRIKTCWLLSDLWFEQVDSVQTLYRSAALHWTQDEQVF